MKMFKGWCSRILYYKKINWSIIPKAYILWLKKINPIIIQTTTIHNISNFEIGIDYGFCFFVFEDLKKLQNFLIKKLFWKE
jgi:hypothetical protein